MKFVTVLCWAVGYYCFIETGQGINKMKTVINGKEFKVEQKGNRFYYFSPMTCRKLPVAKSKVIFS